MTNENNSSYLEIHHGTYILEVKIPNILDFNETAQVNKSGSFIIIVDQDPEKNDKERHKLEFVSTDPQKGTLKILIYGT